MQTHVDEGYIYKLWDFRNLLLHRSEQAKLSEREALLRQAYEVGRNLECYLGKDPKSSEELKKLFAEIKEQPSIESERSFGHARQRREGMADDESWNLGHIA
jgi:hypothetical protein